MLGDIENEYAGGVAFPALSASSMAFLASLLALRLESLWPVLIFLALFLAVECTVCTPREPTDSVRLSVAAAA